ncbi:MAG: hypothetical protein AAF449_13495, partial [Myxococcota bacterium]
QTLVDTIEGLGSAIEQMIRDQLRGNLLAGAGAMLLSRLGKTFGQKLDHSGAGAGIVVGLAGTYLVAHPRSGEKMWSDAIRSAELVVKSGLNEVLRQAHASPH